MKKTHKRILGLLGLVVVVAMTITALFLPAPETKATDTMNIRVIGATPSVNIKNVTNGEIFVSPTQSITVEYENTEQVIVTLGYTDENGVVHNTPLLQGSDGSTDYTAGEITFNFDFLTGNYSYINKDGDEIIGTLDADGYGEYTISVVGQGSDGGEDIDHVSFSFYPVYGEVKREETEAEYKYYLDLHYDTSDNVPANDKVQSISVEVYDADGNALEFSPLTVTPPTDRIELPFAEYGLPDGTYTIKIYAYNQSGDLLYDKPYILTFEYAAKILPVPDTGSFFQSLNISKTDYLVTGLVIFGIVAITGTIFIMQNDKRKAKISRRRK